MFNKLKEKLKGALSLFSKKVEQEAEVVETKESELPVEAKKEAPLTKEKISEKEGTKVIKYIPKSEIDEKKDDGKKKDATFDAKTSLKKQDVQKAGKERKILPKGQQRKNLPEKVVQEIIDLNVVKITYFVHGTTYDNEAGKCTGWKPGELSPLGVRQSKELWRKIENKNFVVVFTSDLKRAIDSADLTFSGKVEIVKDERLREVDYGKYTLLPEDKLKGKLQEYVSNSFPEGESYNDVERRVAEFLNFLYSQYRGRRVAIVAHQAPQLALDVLLSRKTWDQAIRDDWRNTKTWQPGWEYELKGEVVVSEPVVGAKKSFFGKLKDTLSFKKEASVTVQEVKQEVAEVKKVEEKKSEAKGIFQKVKESITTRALSGEKFEELFWDMELALLENNVSIEVIEKIKIDLKKELVNKPLPWDLAGKIMETLQKTLLEIVSLEKIDVLAAVDAKKGKPYVIAFFGINGAGKTTSIAKLTRYFQNHGKTVVLAACDTFRAAAIQQLEEHANILGVKMIKHDYGSDAAAVAFDAVKYAEKNGVDIVLIDTAGRLHSNTNLMAELEKIIRVTKPDLKLFVGESITGNDCIEQARQFRALVHLDGVILTKADVDEKGGAPLSIAYTIKKPILFLGVGQKYEDLEEFKPEEIVKRVGLA